MGAKAGGALSIAVGVIAIIAAIPSGGASLSALTALQTVQVGLAMAGGAAMIGVGIYSLAFSPKASNRGAAKAADMEYASAAEGVPIPVIFGEQRVVGNFMNYTQDNFRSRTVKGRSDGSKGGDSGPSQIVGFDYFLFYEYALCMGSIDEVVQVYATPGERVMMGNDPTPVVYSASDTYKEISLDSVDTVSGSGAEGGMCRLYRGSKTQLRIVANDPYHYGVILVTGQLKAGYQYRIETHSTVNFTSYGAASNDVGTTFTCNNTSGSILSSGNSVTEYQGLNYRNICWSLMIDFKIGRFPQPKTYSYLLRRFPEHDLSFEMVRPDGTSITGFKVRGSTNSAKVAYNEANPAACLYECMTNKIWGRGLSQELFHEASWISVSQYFASRHIGMSFTLESPEKIGSVIDGIRSQFKIVMTFDDGVWKLRCLMDLGTTHDAIQTITTAECRSVKPVRPLWHSTTNDLRVEFQNRTKNFKPDAIHVYDLGNRRMTGRTNSERLWLNGLTDFNTARRQAFRVLKEKSYPFASFQIVMNRFKSQLEVGDVFKLWWNEFDQNTTMFLMVTKIDDSDTSADDMQILAIEDVTLRPVAGNVSTPSIPTVAPWEKIQDMDESEVGLWTGLGSAAPTGDFPLVVIEIPAILAQRWFNEQRGYIAVLAQRPAAYHQLIYTYISQSGRPSSYRQLFTPIQVFCFAGELTANYSRLDYTDRTEDGFTFELFDTRDAAELLSTYSVCDTPDQDLVNVTDINGPWVIIRDELMQIGKIDRLGTNSFRARNIVRGRFGTPIRKFATGQRVMFCANLQASIIPLALDGGNNYNDYGYNEDLNFRAAAEVSGAANRGLGVNLNEDNPVTIYHNTFNFQYQSEDERFMRVSDSALPLELLDVTDNGSDWTIRTRLRTRNKGAATVGQFFSPTEVQHRTQTLSGFSFTVYLQNLIGEYSKIFNATPTLDIETGLITFARIPKTFKPLTAVGPSADTNQIKIVTTENAARKSSVKDLNILNLQ